MKTFGVGALDLLPDNAWDRPALIQSAPGAGKTSLLRMFSAEALREVVTHPNDFEHIYERLAELEIVHDNRAAVLGVRLPLKRDYALIDDLDLEEDARARVFFRLLDAKIVRAVVDALQSALPGVDLASVRWEPSSSNADALANLGGPEAINLAAWSREAQQKLLAQLDSVLPPSPRDLAGHGHHVPYAIHALSGASFSVDGIDLGVRPLLMFDDAQDIGLYRRKRLLDSLADRDLQLHRWIAERYQALSADELIGDGEIDRAYTVVHIEAEARRLRPGGSRRHSGRKTRGFERLLAEISDRRAAQTLHVAAEEERDFSELLDDEIEETDTRTQATNQELNDRLAGLAAGNERYADWISWAHSRGGYQGAVERRVIEILIRRDAGRKQDTLFTVPLTRDDLRGRWDADLAEAAALFLRDEFGLPFYFGTSRLTKLATENIDQHLVLNGALFDEVLTRITLNRSLAIEPYRQDRIVRRVSDQFWRDIPPRLPKGREIQHLLLNIAGLCRRDTYRPTAPYPPGATATAISMRDRQRLIDPAWRASIEGADDLYHALAGAVGHNLLRTELDYSVKGDRWMVLYLNRLLCVRFGLPLGYGGLRERPVEELCRWMTLDRPAEEELVAPVLQEKLPL
ncbi:hypothetical protein [Baekduia sp.]|uniref:ORC-CDC6 family AAA ATPase n=1 Tax=Baekduia sp. TaxID=2600305 RepID=UPI002DF7514D|nr:hypothetical protein [Baekduia sp.]